MLYLFFTGNMKNKKNTPAEVYGIQFPIKCLFEPSRSKTVGEDIFFAEKY